MTTLTRTEAGARAALLRVTGYEVDLDLTTGPETFRSETTVRFRCAEPGTATFADLVPARLHTVELNGRPLPVADVLQGRRLVLSGLAADNVLRVVADCAYSRTGEGLHRFVDPADGLVYTYSQTFLSDAPRMFACFDQPDLKAPVTLGVTVPEGWTVLANAAGRQVRPGRWEFPATPPLATYFTAVVAGPYHSVHAEHDGIALGLHCRRSLAEHLPVDDAFEYTRQAFDHLHRLFGLRYPFGKYDQVMVPEFNAGAMENPGCVTFRDDTFVLRRQVTDADRETLALVIAHEMAHMWFGDLVTMRWWDDLWLNESFAEYMGYRTTAEATRFRDAWTSFCLGRKAWGYRADALPSTHPVAGEVADTEAALLNFDGISYAKGAAVLKQLVAWVGDDAFLAGLRRYVAAHAGGNTTLVDLLDALERESGRDLADWSKRWLRTAGVNTLAADLAVGPDGAYTTAAVLQEAPEAHPVLRPHRVAVGLYDLVDGRLVRRTRVEADVDGPRTPLPELLGVAAADLVLVNDDDLTFAKLRLDERSLRTVLDGLHRLEASLPRSLCWAAAWDLTRDGGLAAAAFVGLVTRSVGGEENPTVRRDALGQAQAAADLYADPRRRDDLLAELADLNLRLTREAPPGSDRQQTHARAFVAAARRPGDVDLLRGWLSGDGAPAGLAVDQDLRWTVLRRLAALGAATAADVAAEHERDRTSNGDLAAAEAGAAVATPAAKEAAWTALMAPDRLSNHLALATVRGFWQRDQVELLRPYVARYLDEVPAVAPRRTQRIAQLLTERLFPEVVVEPATLERTDALLARGSLDPLVRRLVSERRDDLARALRARDRDAASG